MKKTYMLTALMLASVMVVPFCLTADSGTTVYRNSENKTIGTNTSSTGASGTEESTYRDADGKTTGTSTASTAADGSTTTIYRDADGKTVATKTEK
ncbi:MAG: hypothetical protein PHI85_00955 [Victivallaceae bacterium]|nr:hypothetical protein [Victivallaceae bacterium]